MQQVRQVADARMARRAAFKLPLVMTVAAALGRTPRATAQADGPRARWSPERAHRWYAAQGWLVGANFIPSNAVNQLEMFQPATYDPQGEAGTRRQRRRHGGRAGAGALTSGESPSNEEAPRRARGFSFCPRSRGA